MGNGNRDLEAAQLAAGVVRALSHHINSNAPSRRDVELLNPNGLNVREFVNRNYRSPNPNQPQQPPLHHHPPITRQPVGYGEADFAPIPLPNTPIGLYPMGENIKKYAESDSFLPAENNSEFQRVEPSSEVSSFKNTAFNYKPTANSPTTKSQSDDSILDDLRRVIYAQEAEIISLKKKIGTLSTRVYKVLTILEKQFCQPSTPSDNDS
jgi:hypothetical protein